MKHRYSILVALMSFIALGASAQHDHLNCGLQHARERAIQENPQILEWERLQDEFIAQFILEQNKGNRIDTEAVYTIPVVFHIIHQYGPENIPNANIYNQMAILNRDYARQNADTAGVIVPFQSLIAKCKIQFKLATIDPLGNCTNGIDRIVSPLTYLGNDAAKLNPWPRHKYMNVWIVNNMENGVAGYAYYPSATADAMGAWKDGIIIRYNYIGSLSPSSDFTSRALTHEIGHWLDLSHTWGNTNDPEIECGDDNVMDTPPTAGHLSCTNRYDDNCDAAPFPTLANPQDQTYDFSGFGAIHGTEDSISVPFLNDSEGTIAYGSFSSHGVSDTTTVSDEFNFSGWSLGATDGMNGYATLTGSASTSQYYEFSISPQMSQVMSVTGFTFDVSRTSDGPRTFVVRSSVDNFNANLSASLVSANSGLTVQAGNTFFFNVDNALATTGAKITVSGNGFTNLWNGNLRFRIYAFNAEDSAGTFGVDNVVLNGTYGTIENVENYMEYSYCSKMFTIGQKDRMRAALNSPVALRYNLWIPENLAATGTDGINDMACAPTADFYPSTRVVCVGSNVTFSDYSSDADATSWSWEFQDASPATSTSANPSVQFNTPGWKTVTLTATNAVGSTTTTNTMAIYVTPAYAEVAGAMQENCNVNPITQHAFQAYNWAQNETDWEYANNVGYGTANGSLRLNNADAQPNVGGFTGGDIDELLTPSMDLSLLSNGKFTFRYAYATGASTTAAITEKLEVWSSRDCGETWSLRTTIDGTDLANAGSFSSYFVPNTGSQWAYQEVTIPSTFETDNVRFKFVFYSSFYSNNLYLDDINITGSMSVDEMDKAHAIHLYPNPAQDVLNVTLPADGTRFQSMNVRDVSGRLIERVVLNGAAMNRQISINTSKLPAGMYLIELHNGNEVVSEPFMKGNE